MVRTIDNTFLQLVRLGIRTASRATLPDVIKWHDIESLAERQGLLAIIVDGVEILQDGKRPPKVLLLQWIGNTLQNYEKRYNIFCDKLAELSGFFNRHGYKMMVLKGYACSINWPKPQHRPCGDIDIWQFGKQAEADAVISKEKRIKIDSSHHHHTVFEWNGFLVENHYDFINVHDFKSSREIEQILKELGNNDSYFEEVNGEKVYLPSPNLHALFLMRHLVAHFTSVSITLRQVLDWAFFVEKHTKEVDWEWLIGVLNKYHMIEFFNTISGICVEDLGFEASIFPTVQFHSNLKEKVLNDILHPKYSAREPSYLIPRLVYKFRRWQGNAWKQELCYSESRWAAFWSGIWAHLLKPAHL